MNLPLKVLITGTNKGIGNQLVKLFLQRSPNAEIIATSREQSNKAYNRWKTIDKKNRVKCMYLDVASVENIAEFAKNIEKQNVKIDILINNAGVSKTEQLHKTLPDLEFSKQCLNINTLGPIALTERLLPHFSETAKVINISSLYAALKFQPEDVQNFFSNPGIAKEDITNAVSQYIKQIQIKNIVTFSPNVYATSKMLLGAWSRFINQTRWLNGRQQSICVSPGLCLTSMTNDMKPELIAKAFTAESGALKIYENIFFPDLDPNVFYHRARGTSFLTCGQELPWE